MSNLSIGFLGAVVGLLVALFEYLVLLPRILKQLGPGAATAPITFVFRFATPILFGCAGAFIAITLYGSGQ
jgi:hypothetical protein